MTVGHVFVPGAETCRDAGAAQGRGVQAHVRAGRGVRVQVRGGSVCELQHGTGMPGAQGQGVGGNRAGAAG